MRNGFLALIVVVMSAGVASAQEAAKNKFVKDKEWAEKLFVKDNAPHLTHDFGTVARGTQLHHAFPVTNIYAVPIEITSIRRG